MALRGAIWTRNDAVVVNTAGQHDVDDGDCGVNHDFCFASLLFGSQRVDTAHVDRGIQHYPSYCINAS